MATINTGLGGPQDVGEGSFRGSQLTAGNYDDGSVRVNITSVFGSQGINFFGNNYTSIYINTNGLITFAGPVTTYTPSNIANLGYPAIAPYWTDINVTSGSATGTNNIYWDLDPANERVTITWLGVRAYQNPNGQGTNTFQVVLQHTGNGNFELEFIYQQIQWTNGYTGVAQVGMTDGGANDYVVPGSGNASALMQYPSNEFDANDPNGVYAIRFNNGTPVCFAAGTRISTPLGWTRIEELRAGDLVDTLDAGPQPILWTSGADTLAVGAAEPVRILAGVLGNSCDLVVSRQHLMLVAGPEVELLFGEAEVLAAAKDLVDGVGMLRDTGRRMIRYHHLLLPDHHVLIADGALAESLHPGPMAMAALGHIKAADLRSQVGETRLGALSRQPAARRVLKAHEAAVLRAMRGPVQQGLLAA
ncbi:MAG: Hint domain-containing protein [Rhodobacterales bacterium]|nr:Hint domain-containing protein [Rhodobacterales bacterium]MDX5500141.1 Hint domain-containing protein [Rhodobacterales bacterium]